MRLPTRTKHVAKPQSPIGWVKDGKIKVQDGDSGKVGWRGARRGLFRDMDGEPTTARRNSEDAKVPRSHTVHRGSIGKKKAHTTRDSDE